MKIAIVCFNLKWQAGGTRLIYSLAKQLGDLGHTVVIYTPEVNENAYPDLRKQLTIRIVAPAHAYVPEKKARNFFAWIIKKFKQERAEADISKHIAEAMDADFDIVNVHDAYMVALPYKKRNPSVKVIWTENDPPYMYLPKANWYSNLLSWAWNVMKDIHVRAYFKAIDVVAVLDGYNQRWAKERGLSPVIVRGGVDFDNFYLPARKRALATESFTIFSFGALNRYRRFEDIIRASVILTKKGYPIRTQIICKDIWDEPEYKKMLAALVVELHAGAYIELNFAGASNEELKKAFNDASVFVLSTYLPPPRNGYGWGLTNFEAMAAGLPLVICKTSTATEVLTDGKDSLFFEPQNPEDLAKKLEFLITHPSRYTSIAATGQAFVKQNISWEKYAGDVLDLIK